MLSYTITIYKICKSYFFYIYFLYIKQYYVKQYYVIIKANNTKLTLLIIAQKIY